MFTKLVLLIQLPTDREPTAYLTAPLKTEEGVLRGWELRKADGTVYHVINDGGVVRCDCPSTQYSRKFCKHVRAIVERGLLTPAWRPDGRHEAQEASKVFPHAEDDEVA